jgi:hypothetical protein
MVRALLAGTKSQTRRMVKPQPYVDEMGNACWNGRNYGQDVYRNPMFKTLASPIPTSRTKRVLCPYGAPGDRLWVRETWFFEGTDMMRFGRTHSRQDGVVKYMADGARRTITTDWQNVEKWMTRKPINRPGIHMPRWASRITLEITGVRVERLKECNEVDAIAEGAPWAACGAPQEGSHKAGFAQLWESINGPGSWDANPWVWVIEFKRVVEIA